LRWWRLPIEEHASQQTKHRFSTRLA